MQLTPAPTLRINNLSSGVARDLKGQHRSQVTCLRESQGWNTADRARVDLYVRKYFTNPKTHQPSLKVKAWTREKIVLLAASVCTVRWVFFAEKHIKVLFLPRDVINGRLCIFFSLSRVKATSFNWVTAYNCNFRTLISNNDWQV